MDRVEIDNSTLERTSVCHTRVALERIFNLRGKDENMYLICGKAVHKFWEWFFKGAPVDQCIEAFKETYLPWEREQGDLPEQYTSGNLVKLLSAWADKHRDRKFPFQAQLVECGFKVPFPYVDGVDLVGRWDLYGMDIGTGFTCVVDWKTTGKLDSLWVKKWRASSQMGQYLWAAQQIFGQRAWAGYIMGLNIAKVPDSSTKCKTHGVQYKECGGEHIKFETVSVSYTQQKMANWIQAATRLIQEFLQIRNYVGGDLERVKGLAMQGMFNDGCRMCPYGDYCHLYNREPRVVEQMFQVEEYHPLDGLDKESVYVKEVG